MPYDIQGWVEITWCQGEELKEDYAWQSLINLSAVVDVSDPISEQLFGLSKRCTSGEIKIQSLAANRGAPPNPSPQVKSELEQIREHEQKHKTGEFGGYTYVTWHEVGSTLLDADALEKSDWQLVFNLIRSLEQSHRYSAHQIRIVVWCCW